MLVLTRSEGQSIVIGDDIVITVLIRSGNNGDSVIPGAYHDATSPVGKNRWIKTPIFKVKTESELPAQVVADLIEGLSIGESLQGL